MMDIDDDEFKLFVFIFELFLLISKVYGFEIVCCISIDSSI